ncbi:MAG TPA: oxygenase MpaB family protein [Acidimicrobiales bacterium]
MTSRPGDGALLRRYAGDWRSIIEGTSIGLLQLMYPSLGAAVAAQSGFFEDPYGRIYRSIPQIWASILAPDADARARRIRDLHRDIKGTVNGQRYHALDPETFWWAHATFSHLIFRSVERYHWRDRLDAAGYEHLYADTVAWYERYGVSQRAVPASYAEFQTTFDRFCAERLELTPAVERLLEMGDDATPAVRANTPLELLTTPILARWGRLSTIGNLPPRVREHFGLPWTDDDQARLDRLAQAFRLTFETMPPPLNRATFAHALRLTGSWTRTKRYVPREPLGAAGSVGRRSSS